MQLFIKIKILLLVLLFYGFAEAQNSEAIQNYSKARDCYMLGNYKGALLYADMAITADSTFAAGYHLLGKIYYACDDPTTAAACYEKAFSIDPYLDPCLSSKLAKQEWGAGRYVEAKKLIDFFYNYCNPSGDISDIERLKHSIYFSIESVKNPVDFDPVGIGSSINSDADEFWPSLSIDEKTLVFTRIVSGSYSAQNFENLNEDLYISYFVDSVWTNAIPMSNGVNTQHNEGAQCISADGKTIIFTRCDSPEGMGDCDLYIQFQQDGNWTEPINMRSVNSVVWDSNPSLSSDGRTLYFSSTRGGGKGGKDIWMVKINSEGNAVSKAKNLGKVINTRYDEISPFVHPSNSVLYFASDGHIGLGGQDLYMSEMSEKGKWGEPRNLGYPINTHNEERSLIVTGSGELAMFASTRDSINGLDIFKFPVHESFKPLAAAYLKGIIYDSITGERLSAKIQLIDLKTGKTITEIMSGDIYGDYFICLPGGSDYALNVSGDGYLFHSENFSLTESVSGKPHVLNIGLAKVEKEQTIVLRNVFFAYNSYELLPESYPELQKVIEFMADNPRIKIEIGGHTDNRGYDEYNMNLSENRAKAVYDYLIDNRVKTSRLSYKGYSYTKPLNYTDSDEARSQNRRTELRVVKR